MNRFLTYAFLFCIGSCFGWVLELFFRKFFSPSNPEHKWVNPGFCVGPYVPLYGIGLCVSYLLATIWSVLGIDATLGGRLLLFLGMAAGMTVIEYIAGILCLKVLKVRLWDYSEMWGNIQGLVCPLFSLIWGAMGALYYYLLHPYALLATGQISGSLAFSFGIGMFYGVFAVDVVYSAHLVARIKAFAEENDVIVKYEKLKAHVRSMQEKISRKPRFLFFFYSEGALIENLRSARNDVIEKTKKTLSVKGRGKRGKRISK